MALTLSPHIQKMYDQARKAASNRPKVAAPRRTAVKASRCTMLHEGERIVFDLSTAKTCPPGFMSIAKGVYVKPSGVPKAAPKLKAAPKARKAKAAPKARKAKAAPKPKAAKKVAKKASKKQRTPAQIAATKRMLAARKKSLKKKR